MTTVGGTNSSTPLSQVKTGFNVHEEGGTFYAVDMTDGCVLANAFSNPITISLPPAGESDDFYVVIKKIDSTDNIVTIDGYNGETIDGNLAMELMGQYESITVICDGNEWFVWSPSAKSIDIFTAIGTTFPIYKYMLYNNGFYTAQQIDDGFIENVFVDETYLPASSPLGSTTPTFAGLLDGYIAFWDWVGQTGWVVTSFPWLNPIVAPEYIVEQNNGIGSGNSAWQFSMGTEFRVLAAASGGTISKLSMKHNTTANRSWAILKSTSVGLSPPVLSTYTTVVANGTFTNAVANSWEDVTGFTPVTVLENEWYACMAWVGTGGQTYATGDRSGLNENLAVINGGIYVTSPGVAPGLNPTPTNRVATTLYGIVAVEITP